MSNWRPVARSNIQVFSSPEDTIVCALVANPSLSKGLDAPDLKRRGSSKTLNSDGRTCSPKESRSQLDPLAIAPPLIADMRCPIRLAETRRSKITG